MHMLKPHRESVNMVVNKSAVLAIYKHLNAGCRDDFDRLMLVTHAYIATEGFTLIATGKKSECLQEIDAKAKEVTLEGWQELEPQGYSFSYVQAEGKRERVQVTGIVMEGVLVVHFLSPDTDFRPATAELYTSEFAQGPPESGGLAKVDALLNQLNAALISAIHFPTKAEQNTSDTTETASTSARQTERRGGSQPDDDLRVLRDIRPVGQDDLLPPGMPREIQPGRPGIIGDPDDPGMQGGGRIGGSHVGPNDPIFSRRFPSDRLPHGPFPGARYDPIGPEGTLGYNSEDLLPRGNRGLHPDLAQPGCMFWDLEMPGGRSGLGGRHGPNRGEFGGGPDGLGGGFGF